MVHTSKILTVSYGTFSCTLEGFDDSFETMKAIAEYFRDLAADDRYFGAEPPQPDADMLARIAQKEISRQVEAHRDGNEFLLRAAESAMQPPTRTATAAPAPVPEPVAEAPAMPASVPTPPVVDEPVANAVETAPVEILDPTPSDTAAGPSMADKLARIRAVVGRAEAIDEDQLEDIDTDAFAMGTGEALTETLAEVVTDVATEEPVAEAAISDEAPAEDPVAEAAISNEAPAEEPMAETAISDEVRSDDGADLIGSVLAATAEPDEADKAEVEADLDEDSLFRDLASDGDDELTTAEDSLEDNLLAEEPAESGTGRVVKVKRSDLEDAMAAVDQPSETPASSLSETDEADLQSELDAVAAELAEAQAALNPPDEIDEIDDLDDAVGTMSEDAHRAREERADAMKSSTPPVTRLLAEAEGKMDDPESAMSREAYDHLRAAVSATRAEGDDQPKPLADTAYREDLADVVRPRRPDAGSPSARSQRPDDARPAPLKLVAEQRIDTDAPQSGQRGPIRPRRVASDADDASETASGERGGFAAFAAEAGATELPDLLEAAAAYMSFVEGWEQFSRPQLMTRVKQVENCGFNREDGLRTFGQLLREGKIEKTSGGRFTASDRIGFRPTRKAAG